MPSGTALSYGLSRFSCHTMIPFSERSPSSTGQLAPRSPSSVRCLFTVSRSTVYHAIQRADRTADADADAAQVSQPQGCSQH
jgi:hypothetical protein